MHAKALSDPLYRTKLEEAEKATKGALGPFCNACHGPIAVMSGELKGVDQSKMTSASADAITCDFCHRVTGTTSPLGNTSQTVARNRDKRAQIKRPQAPHGTQYSEFHKTAEFCGSCHDVIHPAVPGLLLEATYTEWKHGPYAEQGIVCQDCHMTPGPGPAFPSPRKAAGMGPERLGVYSMTFAGGNVGLGDSALAEERLKAAAALDMAVPEGAKPGASVVVTTTVTNVGAGHYLPTGLTEMRQMWLEVTARDSSGDDRLIEKREFGTVLRDAAGRHPVELWEATAIQSDDRIPPKQSVTDTAVVTMGDKPLTVTATLYYRSVPEDFAKKAGVKIPTTEMAVVSQQMLPVAVGTEGRAAPAGERPSSRLLPAAALAALSVAVLLGVVIWFARRRSSAS
jgi:hypothetical protein